MLTPGLAVDRAERVHRPEGARAGARDLVAGSSAWRPRAGRSSAESWSARSAGGRVFWVNVPIGAAMILAATVRYVPESRAPQPRRVDVPGQLLMIGFLGSLTYAVIQGPVSGWAAPPIIALFAVAAVEPSDLRDRRAAPHTKPLLELRFFRSHAVHRRQRDRRARPSSSSAGSCS